MLSRRPSGGRLDRGRAGGQTPLFSGDFASFLQRVGVTALQVVQVDRGMTYGGTMLQTGVGTTVITLTGALNSGLAVVPIGVLCTLLGARGVWTGSVTYDSGLTFEQTFTSSATVALTGKGAGLTLNIDATAALGTEAWVATCAALADQSGNAFHFAQATAAQQPILARSGTTTYLQMSAGISALAAATYSHVAPGTTPFWMLTVFRQDVWNGAGAQDLLWFDNSGNNGVYQITASPTLQSIGNTAITNSAGAVGSWFRGAQLYDNTVNSYWRIGATQTTGAMGNNISTAPGWLGWTTAARRAAWSFYARIIVNGEPSASQRAAIDAAIASIPGLSVSV